MNAIAERHSVGILHGRRPLGAVHRLALAFVWLTIASGAFVFTEPAPFDILMLGIVGLLPLIGLTIFTPSLVVGASLLIAITATTLLASINALDLPKALIHNGVSIYLYAATLVLAAFVIHSPKRHANLLLHGYLAAAFIAAIAGLLGYFDLPPGARDLFTRYGRATATFKDPNVFGPFLTPALMFLLHRILTRPFHRSLGAFVGSALLGVALLLSFSRGAWVTCAVAVAVYAYLAFVTAASDRLRVRLIALVIGGGLAATVLLAALLQFDAVADLFEERATLSQTYDEGPEGRFGGQQKAIALILENPFGLGAQQFAPEHHFEEPHNVYLAMMLNCGWLGGLLFILLIGLTTLYGLRHAFRRTETQGLFLVAYACLVGHVCVGLVIDLDHWRHFWLLVALVWGLMLGDRQIVSSIRMAAPRPIFENAGVIGPSRPPRLLRPARHVITATPSRRRVSNRPEHPAGRAIGYRRTK